MATNFRQLKTARLFLFLASGLLCGCQGGIWVTETLPPAERKVTIDGQEAPSELLAAVKQKSLTKLSPTLNTRPLNTRHGAPFPAELGPRTPTTNRPNRYPTAQSSQQQLNRFASDPSRPSVTPQPQSAASVATRQPATPATNRVLAPVVAPTTSAATPVVHPVSAVPPTQHWPTAERTASKTTPPTSGHRPVSTTLPKTTLSEVRPTTATKKVSNTKTSTPIRSEENFVSPWIDQIQLKMISRDARGQAIVMLKVGDAQTIVAQEGETISLELNTEVIPVTVEQVNRQSVQLRNGLTNRQRILR